MGHLGNKMEKGNCCGGYNSLNEDFIWEMFKQAYPNHSVEAVTPYSTTQNESYDGVTSGGCSVLYGTFQQNSDVTLSLSMIDMRGVVLNIGVISSSPFNNPSFIAVTNVDVIVGVFPSAWQFVGWQVQLNGPVIVGGGLEIDFMYLIGGSYPIENELPVSCELTPLSPYYSYVDNKVTLNPGVTSLTVQLLIDRLELGNTNVFETYTVEEVQKVFRMNEGTITVTAVSNATDNKQLVTLTISGIFNPVSFFYWIKDAAVKFTSNSADYNLEMNGLEFFQDGEVVETVTIAGAVNASTEGHCSALALVRNRDIRFSTENDTAFDTDITAKPFGSAAVTVAVAQPGATNPEGSLDVTLYSQILWRQPAIEISIGTPA